MQHHGSKYFAHSPRPDTQGGVKRSKFNFFIHCHVAYQIKGNHKCSNMEANILPADPHHPLTLGRGQQGQNSSFSEYGHIAYQLNGITNAAT